VNHKKPIYYLAFLIDYIIPRYYPISVLIVVLFVGLRLKSDLVHAINLTAIILNATFYFVFSNKVTKRLYRSASIPPFFTYAYFKRNFPEFIYVFLSFSIIILYLVTWNTGFYPILNSKIDLTIEDLKLPKEYGSNTKYKLIVRDRNLSGIYFKNSDLSDIKFKNVNLSGCVIINTEISNLTLINSDLSRCILIN
ncbi:pentapeptide repeat-containing protein, partial [Leptospira interrogans]